MPVARVDVLIVVAVKVEQDGVTALHPGAWVECKDSAGFVYRRASIGGLSYGLARASDMGETQAAITATRLIQELKPQCLAMTGICAAKRDPNVSLGDVVVAERVFKYDAGKLRRTPVGDDLSGDITTYNLDARWKQAAQEFDSEWTSELLPHLPPHAHDPKGNTPSRASIRVHVAPIATGSAVVEDSEIFARIRKSMRKTLALDMEASAIAAVADAERVPHRIIVKGIVDFADEQKDDRYQMFAARASARFLFAFLERHFDPPDRKPPPCPYPGTRPFDTHEARLFFGREKLSDALRKRIELGGQRRLCIIGPSGCGKSSLVNAGLLPRIDGSSRPSDFAIRSMRPTHAPLSQLRNVLELDDANLSRGVASLLEREQKPQLLLFIDQLEELFTVAVKRESNEFMSALEQLTRDTRFTVIAAMRADFMSAMMESPLWELFEGAREFVATVGRQQLAKVITGPAHEAGITIEPELVERLVSEAIGEPGTLPLLQATLVELWDTLASKEKRAQRQICSADYENLGDDNSTGLAVAFARRADALLSNLTRPQRAIARRVLLSLVSFGDGRSHTRRQQPLSKLERGEDSILFRDTIAALVEKRILTTSRQYVNEANGEADVVDLSHEILLSSWPTLRDWIESGRVDEERRRSLQQKVKEWHEAGDDKLLDAVEIKDAERWLARDSDEVGVISGLAELVTRSRLFYEGIERQRDEARRLLAASYSEHARRLALDGHPMRALPYLVAAREIEQTCQSESSASLGILFADVVRSLPQAAYFHDAPVERTTFDRHGNHVASAGRDGLVKIWSRQREQMVCEIEHPAPVLDVAFCPGYPGIVTAAADGHVRVWALEAGAAKLVDQVSPHASPIHRICLAPDGTTIVFAAWNHDVHVWKPIRGTLSGPMRFGDKISRIAIDATGSRLLVAGSHRVARVYNIDDATPVFGLVHDDQVRDATFDSTGELIATASSDRTARVWDATTGALHVVVQHEKSVRRVAFDPTARRIATASGVRARVWDPVSGEPISDPIDHGSGVAAVAFSPNGKLLATASSDRTVRLSDPSTGRPICAPFEHAREVQSCSFDPTGKFLLSTSADCGVRIWSVTAGTSNCVGLAHSKGWINTTALDASEQYLVTAGSDRTARLWHVPTASLIGQPLQHDDQVVVAVFSPDGDFVVSASGRVVSVWDRRTMQRLHQLRHAEAVHSLAFRPHSSELVTAAKSEVATWDVTTGTRTGALPHAAYVSRVVWSPDGAVILTTCADRIARLWRGVEAAGLPHDGAVLTGCFSRDGALVVTGSRDRTARIWHAGSGTPASAPLLHADEVRRVAFNADATRVATASANTVRVWDIRSAKPVLDPLEHEKPVLDVCFSIDGLLIATASEDGKACVWDARTGKAITAPLKHSKRVNRVAFTRDARAIVTASGDNIARIWRIGSDPQTLDDWRTLLARCPYSLIDGVLVENEHK